MYIYIYYIYMAGSVNSCVEISLGIVQKKTLSFSSNPEQSASEPLSFSTKIVMLAAISMPDPYRFPAFQQNACFCHSRHAHPRGITTIRKHDYGWDVRHVGGLEP